MAVDPDGKLRPVSEFTAEEKWWCDGEDCYGEFSFPHVHPYIGPERRVDLLTGREIEPEMCPGGCGCRLGTADADRRECGCDGGCCDDPEVIP